MNIKDILGGLTAEDAVKERVFDNSYYTNIYKKTEKIATAIYIVTDIEDIKDSFVSRIESVRESSYRALTYALSLASCDVRDIAPQKSLFVRELLLIRSTLAILSGARVVKGELAEVIMRELDALIQNIHFYTVTEVRKHRLVETTPMPTTAPAVRPVRERAVVGTEVLGDRRTRILDIVRAKGVVAIKDISDTMRDVSDKTIQRELLDMVSEGLLLKEGERRWSRYRMKQ